MVPKIFYGPVLHAFRLMKFLSVRNGASGPRSIKKKGGPARDKHKPASSQAHKLSSLTMKQYPLLWDFIRLNRKG